MRSKFALQIAAVRTCNVLVIQHKTIANPHTYPSLMPTFAGLLERRRSRFRLLKSTFNTGNFMFRLSGSSSSHSGAIHCQNVCHSPKLTKKFKKTPNFVGSRSLNVIDVDKTKQPVTCACYDKQHVSTYLQPFSH